MKTLYELLNEAREADLYHSTNLFSLINILDKNKILAYTSSKINGAEKFGVSLTRDLEFAKNWRMNYQLGDGSVILIIDQEKLHRDFGKKLRPVDYYQTTPGRGFTQPNRKEKSNRKMPDNSQIQFEAEEFLMSELKPLKKYLKGIYLSKTALADYKSRLQDKDKDTVGITHHSEKQIIEKILKLTQGIYGPEPPKYS